MTKSISRSQVRLIASTNAIFGADEACAMLRISCDAMYRLAPPALTVRVCYKVTGGPLSYLQVPGESPGYFLSIPLGVPIGLGAQHLRRRERTAATRLATTCSHSSFTTRKTASPRRSRTMRPSLPGAISPTFRFTPSPS